MTRAGEVGGDAAIQAHDEDVEQRGVKVYFDPFAFTIEQNNEFIAKGYEPIFLRRVPGD